MSMRILSAADVRRAVDMSSAIDVMRGAFSALSSGDATVPVRLPLATDQGLTLFMPAHTEGSTGVKIASVTPGNAARGRPTIQAVVLLLDPETGGTVALMDGTWLTALRTGAAGGLATDLLARENATVVALFGAGAQARTQIAAARCVRPVSEVRVVSRSGASADVLAGELDGVSARRVDDPAEAVAGADIVIAATDSATPVFDGSLVEPGTHVTGVGSYTVDMREVDTALLLRSTVVVDQRSAALEEAGDIVGPIRDGDVDASIMAAELGEIVLGRAPGRTRPDEITFFKSVGNAVQDVAVAGLVLRRAEAEGLGLTVEV